MPQLIQTSAEFVANFVPPDYLIDGVLQRRFVYAMTAPTGAGKTSIALRTAAHIALGLKLGIHEVERGKVLVLVGENQDDSRMRWIKLCDEMGQKPEDVPVYFLPSNPRLSDAAVRKQIDEESALHGPFVLVIVDTSTAYFEGDDENNNVQMVKHARMLRTFTKLPEGPTIIILCHPTKNASDSEDLVPRGGGAFLNEIDTNLICVKDDIISHLHYARKIRGVDFAPIAFEVLRGTTERLTDSKGRPIWTVTARPITSDEQTNKEQQVRTDEDLLMLLMQDQPGLSMTKMAETLKWSYSNGQPNKSRVDRIMRRLAKEKFVKKVREEWQLTKEGTKAAQESPAARAAECM